MTYYIITTESLKYYIVNEKMEITQYKYNYPNWEYSNFTGNWTVKGLVEILPFGNIGRLQYIENMIDKNLKFKNGKGRFLLVDIDCGTTRIWSDRVVNISREEF